VPPVFERMKKDLLTTLNLRKREVAFPTYNTLMQTINRMDQALTEVCASVASRLNKPTRPQFQADRFHLPLTADMWLMEHRQMELAIWRYANAALDRFIESRLSMLDSLVADNALGLAHWLGQGACRYYFY